MKRVERSALLPHSAEFMFNLVNNVADYSSFLPWCKSSEVLSQTKDEVIAKLTMAGFGMQRAFTTCNRLSPPHRIDLSLVEGPFREFQGSWQFTQLGEDGCKVHLHLQFEVASLPIRAALDRAMSAAAGKMVDAFCTRAQQLQSQAVS